MCSPPWSSRGGQRAAQEDWAGRHGPTGHAPNPSASPASYWCFSVGKTQEAPAATGTDTFCVSPHVSILPPQSDGRSMLSPTSKEGWGTGEMLKPPGEWGLLAALDLEAQPLQAANVQPARAQQHLRPAQPCRPSCLRPQWLLLPPQARPWSDGVPRGLLLQRLRRHFLTRCPLLPPSRIKSQGRWGACVQCLVPRRGEERAHPAQPSQGSPAGRAPAPRAPAAPGALPPASQI